MTKQRNMKHKSVLMTIYHITAPLRWKWTKIIVYSVLIAACIVIGLNIKILIR